MPDIYIKDYDTTVSFDASVPMPEIEKALKAQFPPKRNLGEKALDFATMGHVGAEYGPDTEVSFTPEGKMQNNIKSVPSGDPGFFQDPVTALAMGGVAGIRAAAGPVGRLVTAGKEALGWATGGVSDIPKIATSGVKGVVKGIEAKNAAQNVAKRQEGSVFANVTPDAVVSTDNIGSLVADTANVAPKTVTGLDKLAEAQNLKAQEGAIHIGTPPPPKPTIGFDDPIVQERFTAAAGTTNPTFWDKTKDLGESLYKNATRTYSELPNVPEYAPLVFDLKKLEKQREVAKDSSIRLIGEITSTLDKDTYEVFNKKVILDDLAYEAEQGRYLPFGLTPESLAVEKQKFDTLAGSNPAVIEALNKRKMSWDLLKAKYKEALDPVGVDTSHIFGKTLADGSFVKGNENYFRHQVLEYAKGGEGLYGSGQKLKTPSGSSNLKARTMKSGEDLGAKYDINSDYIQPEHQVMGQMIHDIQVAKTLKSIQKNYDIKPQLAKTPGGWDGKIPEGYVEWQPREGNVFYVADTVPSKMAQEIQDGILTDIAEIPDKIKPALAMGGPRLSWVVKKEVAATLNDLVKSKEVGPLAKVGDLSQGTMRAWKQWQLISPRRFFKYNARNLSGDFEAMLIGNPTAIPKTGRALREIVNLTYFKKPMTPEFKEWFDRGGMSSTLQANEMNEIKRLWMFDRLYKDKGNVKDIPGKVSERYWSAAKSATDAREAVGRYASYLDFKEQMLQNNGVPRTFGASKPEDIMALKSIEDRAYALSNDVLGAYDRTSVLGQGIAEHLIPFWRFQEVNMKRYIQFAKNASRNDKLAGFIGKKLGAGTMSAALRTGKFVVQASALTSALTAYNHMMFPEEEENLPEDVKAKPHIVLGRNEDGTTNYFSRLGILGDALEWAGVNTAIKETRRYLNGDQSLIDTAKGIAVGVPKDISNKLWGGAIPLTKLGGEVITRTSTFPSLWDRGTIRDRGEYVARSLGVSDEYKALPGINKPSPGYLKSIPNIFSYQNDPYESAYRKIYDKKNKFKEEHGGGGEGYWLNARGEALSNYRKALRYNDVEAQKQAISDYHELGGKDENIQRSIENMAPLANLSNQQKQMFYDSLNTEERELLRKADIHFQTTLQGIPRPGTK